MVELSAADIILQLHEEPSRSYVGKFVSLLNTPATLHSSQALSKITPKFSLARPK